jgi:hypothetical protein
MGNSRSGKPSVAGRSGPASPELDDLIANLRGVADLVCPHNLSDDSTISPGCTTNDRASDQLCMRATATAMEVQTFVIHARAALTALLLAQDACSSETVELFSSQLQREPKLIHSLCVVVTNLVGDECVGQSKAKTSALDIIAVCLLLVINPLSWPVAAGNMFLSKQKTARDHHIRRSAIVEHLLLMCTASHSPGHRDLSDVHDAVLDSELWQSLTDDKLWLASLMSLSIDADEQTQYVATAIVALMLAPKRDAGWFQVSGFAGLLLGNALSMDADTRLTACCAIAHATASNCDGVSPLERLLDAGLLNCLITLLRIGDTSCLLPVSWTLCRITHNCVNESALKQGEKSGAPLDIELVQALVMLTCQCADSLALLSTRLGETCLPVKNLELAGQQVMGETTTTRNVMMTIRVATLTCYSLSQLCSLPDVCSDLYTAHAGGNVGDGASSNTQATQLVRALASIQIAQRRLTHELPQLQGALGMLHCAAGLLVARLCHHSQGIRALLSAQVPVVPTLLSLAASRKDMARLLAFLCLDSTMLALPLLHDCCFSTLSRVAMLCENKPGLSLQLAQGGVVRATRHVTKGAKDPRLPKE